MKRILALFGALVCALSAASSYDFLDRFETPPTHWTRELPPRGAVAAPPLEIDLSPFHDMFRKEGVVKVYYGLGYEAYRSTSAKTLFDMLRKVTSEYRLPLRGFSLNGARTAIAFRNANTGVRFEITLGNERNAWGKAFADHAIVMYHGHSRYGRGPAFRSFTNYFRMGDVFKTIEVDTRNAYFRDEPLQLTAEYPPATANFGGDRLAYQYRGQRVESSYLPKNAYTKNIPGEDIDLINTGFRPGKQLIWMYSCSNILYFRNPLRKRFPDPNEKPVFGTSLEGMWSEKPAAVFLGLIASEEKSSRTIVEEQNATHDCANCFTVY